MAALLFSTPGIFSCSKAQCREASEPPLRQQLYGRVNDQFGISGRATNTRAKLPRTRSTNNINVVAFRRTGAPGCNTFTLRAPLRSRRTLEVYEPSVRLVEDETAYKFIAAVPGVAADDVTLNVTDDGLLKMEAKRNGRELLNRTVSLVSDSDLKAISAVCIDGILEVTVNKLQPPSPIPVSVSASEPPTTDELYVIQKKLPGISASEVSVTLEPLRMARSAQLYELVIHANSNKGYGEYHFNQTLPEDIIPEGATAFCAHGLLHVKVPRREPVRVAVPVASVDETSSKEEQLQLAQFKAPGYSAEQVFVWATDGCLSVKFQRSPKEVTERLVVLPDEVNLSSIRAVCVDGVLTVKVAKSALRQTETRRVVVSAERS